MRPFQTLSRLIALTFCLTFAASVSAQGQFTPAVTVNDSVITEFEVDQRRQLLILFRTPGADRALAIEQLVDDRLKQAELRRTGISIGEDELQAALNDFAGRANLTLDQFLTILAQSGVSEETFRDFVSIGVTWRDYIRARYNRQSSISDAEVARAIAGGGSSRSEIEVLMNEIIIAAPPPRAAQANAEAARIAQIRSLSAFEAAARRVSALPSRANGGRLGWLPVSNYPPQLQAILLALSPGEVTAPIPITNGVALFQLRDVREVLRPATPPSSIDYAAYYIAGDRTAAAALASRVDTCDDLYGVAQGQPAEVLERNTVTPSEIPSDVAIELARLDPGEVSYNLTRNGGQTVMFLMLCNRVSDTADAADPDAVRNNLRSQRLAGFADALLADLRAAATIRR